MMSSMGHLAVADRFTWIYAFLVIFYTLWLLTVHYKARPSPGPSVLGPQRRFAKHGNPSIRHCHICVTGRTTSRCTTTSPKKGPVQTASSEQHRHACHRDLAEVQDIAGRALTLPQPSCSTQCCRSPQRYMKLHQAYLVTSLEGADAWKHPTSFSLGIGAAVDDVGHKDYDLRYSNLCNTCLPCRARRPCSLYCTVVVDGQRSGTSPRHSRCAAASLLSRHSCQTVRRWVTAIPLLDPKERVSLPCLDTMPQPELDPHHAVSPLLTQ